MDNQWRFPESDLSLSGDDTLLGKGAYGEVRRCEWRGTEVAGKRLHALNGGAYGELSKDEIKCVREDFLREMDMLSRVRQKLHHMAFS